MKSNKKEISKAGSLNEFNLILIPQWQKRKRQRKRNKQKRPLLTSGEGSPLLYK